MRIFVTGATGFIGQRLVARLVDEGHEVLGTTRSPEGVTRLQAMGAEGLVLDLCEPVVPWSAALTRAAPDVVVHLAAELATQRRASRIHAVDEGGTRTLVQALLAVRERWGFPSQLVHAGTVVVGDPRGALLTEDAPLHAETAYGRAKLAAEALCAGAAERGVGVTIVRPSHVYGPGGWFGGILGDLRRGRFFVPGDGSNLWDLAHVDDVVDAFFRAVHAPAAGVEVYHVADDTPLTLRAFIDAAAEALGVARPRSVPVWLARLVAGRGPVAAAVRSARSSNARLRARLGWRPRWPDARQALPSVVAAFSVTQG